MVQWLAFLMVSFCFLVDGCCLFFLPPSYFATHMLPAAVGRPTKKTNINRDFSLRVDFRKNGPVTADQQVWGMDALKACSSHIITRP